MNHRKKRGQITIFIVAGIIILIAVGLFFLFRYLSIQEPVIAVPEEIAPVASFVQDCMATTLTDAVTLAGIQGGWITIPEDLAENPFGHLPVAGTIKTPMWYYGGTLRVPEIFEIEDGLATYVQQNLDLCLQNFTEIEAFTVIKQAEPVVSVTVNKEDVRAYIVMPVEIFKDGQRYEWDEFTTKIDAKLFKAYETAVQVLNNENSNMFLESMTIDMIALDPDIPLTDFRFDSCRRLTWSKSSIVTRLKDTLYYNIPRLRVNRTLYDRFEQGEDYQKNHFVIDALDQANRDVLVGFRFDEDWPLLMTVRPSDGDILKANSGKGFAKYLAFLCMNVYHFTYDIEYPVEVIIREETSFNGQGYLFRFATPVIIKQNQGSRDYVGEPSLELPRFEPEFCDRKTDKGYEIRAVDAESNEELNANISFECLVFRCDLGKTQLSADDLYVNLMTQLPSSCTGGNLIVNEQYDPDLNLGYFESLLHIDLEEEGPFKIPVKQYKKLEINAKKYRKDDLTTGLDLEQGEELFIQLENESMDYSEFYAWNLEDEEEQEKVNLLLGEGSYDVTLMLTKEERYVGGYRGRLDLTFSDVADNDVIEFPVIVDETVLTDDEVVDLITFIEGQTYTLKPELR
ncbi:hypothetical protein KY328_05885 [Candidatus Woesearchaeota archaeon]|nr:hypothetical protein [Candidatus Woesearchaeota archaeon]MBW3022430.1 hypothetical protein [Candidatus Woesearchaeota archaeon]